MAAHVHGVVVDVLDERPDELGGRRSDVEIGQILGVIGGAEEHAVCAIGPSGGYLWTGVPSADLFFLVVGTDLLGVYESSWGTDGTGAQRAGTSASWMCGVTTKDATETCP